MILLDYFTPIAKLLANAATTNATVSFNEFHNIFAQDVADNDKYDTLEAVSIALCPPKHAIYSALLSKKQTNCPGTGFYDIYRNIRQSEYQKLAGNTLIQELSIQKQLDIATEERDRVYLHAKQNRYC